MKKIVLSLALIAMVGGAFVSCKNAAKEKSSTEDTITVTEEGANAVEEGANAVEEATTPAVEEAAK